MGELIPQEIVEQKIFVIRGHKVMLDKNLAVLYGVETRNLNKAVTRNLERFPEDFMFQLTTEEVKNLMFHFGTSSWGGTRKMPRVFTEHGILMLSSVLKSKRAAHVNIQIIPDFSLEKSAPSDSEGLQDQTRREFGLFCRVSQILRLHKIVRSKNPGLPRKIGKSSSDLPNDPFGANFAIAKFGIMRTFVKLRRMLESNEELLKKIEEMEKRYDHQFKIIFEAMKELMSTAPEKPKRQIGFLAG